MPDRVSSGAVDVVLDVERERDGSLVALAKICSDVYEVNVRAPVAQLEKLAAIRGASWPDRRSIRLGRCAEADVFWCASAEGATIMIGHDDETWDVAIEVPFSVIEAIVSFVPNPPELRTTDEGTSPPSSE